MRDAGRGRTAHRRGGLSAGTGARGHIPTGALGPSGTLARWTALGRSAVDPDGCARRRCARRGDHARPVSARGHRPGRHPRRGVPARGDRRRDFWPVWLGVVTTRGLRGGVQLLPPAAHGAVHARRARTTGSRWRRSSLVGLATCSVAAVARRRAVEAEMRREEADLAAEAARLLLGERDLGDALKLGRRAGRHRARPAVGRDRAGRRRTRAQPSGPRARPRAGARRAGGPGAARSRPARRADRPRTRAGRRGGAGARVAAGRGRGDRGAAPSDVAKTAVLRAVSHDLRSPLTAMVTAGEALALACAGGGRARRARLGVVDEGSRLSRLIEKLLDLSRLQSGAADAAPSSSRSRTCCARRRTTRAARTASSCRSGRCRRSARTPRSSSAPSRTSWRTPRATAADTR